MKKKRTKAQNADLKKARELALEAAEDLKDLPDTLVGDFLVDFVDEVAGKLSEAASLLEDMEIDGSLGSHFV